VSGVKLGAGGVWRFGVLVEGIHTTSVRIGFKIANVSLSVRRLRRGLSYYL
jgi:hypothetical protein